MMKWYYKLLGSHVHVRVFMHGMCGKLVFDETDFDAIRKTPLVNATITFINEDHPKSEGCGEGLCPGGD